jgi:succinyl-diaminopimelate desuccinylase
MTATDALSIARALVQCPSVTPVEGGALSYLDGLLRNAGFAVHRPVFSEPGTPDIDNLYARIGEGGPCLVFAGHTDVVPPGKPEAWTHPPFAADIADGRLYGRGAEDMKGGVAASVAAVLAHLKAHGAPKNGSIAFLITGDEEGLAVNGTVKLLAWAKERGEPMDHCILGEPTNVEALGDMIKIGRRGSLTGHITIHGKQGHVAYPERAENPIHGMTRLLTSLLATPLDTGTAHFGPTNLEMTTVDVGNPTSNVVPGEAKATFNIRFNDLWTPQTLEAEIRRRLDAAAGVRQDERRRLPDRARAFRDPGGGRRRRSDRPQAATLDHGRHLRRTFHQRLLSGSRIWPRRPHHASGGREHRHRRAGAADSGLCPRPAGLFRGLISAGRSGASGT